MSIRINATPNTPSRRLSLVFVLVAIIAVPIETSLKAPTSTLVWTVVVAGLAIAINEAMPGIRTWTKFLLAAVLRTILPYSNKVLSAQETLSIVANAHNLPVEALAAAERSNGELNLEMLQALTAGAETDVTSLRSMVRGIALTALSLNYRFTAIGQAERQSAQAELERKLALQRKADARQLFETQVATLQEQLNIRLAEEDNVAGEKAAIIEGLNPLLQVAAETGLTGNDLIN